MGVSDRIQGVATKTILALFFLSGMTGLSYEVIWFKQFSHVWGSSTLAMASVVGAFLLGLGLGARVWGPIADRVTRPVLWYGICEIGIGVLALLIPFEVDLLWQFSVSYYSSLREFPIWYALVRFATTFTVIGPPCMLMGATLPLLVRQLTSGFKLGKATGWLYGINTLGAALGCYLVGFHLLPEFGLSQSNIITATANLVIGVSAVILAFRREFAMTSPISLVIEREVESPDDLLHQHAIPLNMIYLIAALTGCAALMLQTVWSRQLALVLGSSTYAFSAMLFVVLTGIGFGSLLFEAVISKFEDDGSILIHTVSGSVITAIAGIWLLPFAADCVGVSIPLRANYTVNALVCILGSALVELLPAIAMGILFPLLVRISTRSPSRTGTSVGNVYAWNTLGALVGSIATSVWIVPEWGTRAALIVAIHLYLSIAVALATSRRSNVAAYAIMTIAVVFIVSFFKMPDDPLRNNRGMFMYGYGRLDRDSSKVLFFKEGSACNVLVTQQGDNVSFRVNGKVDGSSQGDMSMQAGLAYLPRLLNPDAKNVLVIGFGTGTTSGASLQFPDTDVICCELEPAVVSASPYFAEVNHKPQDSSRFKVVYDDARAYVQGTTERFDLILSEPSNPWIAGVSNLFTAEFYNIASRKLAPNGIFAQWIQTYSFTPDDYAMIVRTMSDVFPCQRLIRISDVDTILLGSNEAFDYTTATIRASQRLVDEAPGVKADLKRYFATSDVSDLLLTRLLLDERGLQKFVDANGNVRRNLDGDQQLEFRAARHLYEKHANDAGNAILGAASSDWLIEQFDRLQGDELHSQPLNELATLFLDMGHKPTAASLVQFGLSKKPNATDLLASQLILSPHFDATLLDRLLALSDDSVAFHANRVGLSYWNKQQFSDAVKVFEGICAKFPQSATCWTNLALNYERLGDLQNSERAYRRALEMDAVNAFTLRESKRLIPNIARSVNE
ncbi:MAG: fused MFS/spermidine synthase [Planctomycetota bacterium]